MAKLQLTYNFDTPEQLIAHLQSVTGKAAAPAPTTTLVAPVATPVAAPVEVPAEVITDAVDKDGLPWNAEYHSDPKSFNDDGTWRSKRGKSEEAKKARAAFLAKGGAVTAPVIPAAPVAAMPTMPVAAPAMPTMPVAAPVLPPPISYEQLIAKVTNMMTTGVVDGPTVVAMYAQAGYPDPSVFETNETARRALYNVLLTKQPD